jgi:rhodanese-related sulfurtransferase
MIERWKCALAGLLLLIPGAVAAAELPALPAGTKPISTDELKTLFDRHEKFTLINALSPLEYTQTKISGSINIPYGHLRDREARLPVDKAERLVFYCYAPQ